jgi:hypothetical protein
MDERQIAKRESEARRVIVTPDDVGQPRYLYLNDGRQIGLITDTDEPGVIAFIPSDESRRVTADPGDVMTEPERFVRDAIVDETSRQIREAYARAEEELLYGYVGGWADHEDLRRDARRRASNQIINQAIDDVRRGESDGSGRPCRD